ncbi:hypothetical protein F4809DRAFT_646274 [Biscogniauxia mediterranea]|nr:hypothetical protein F4809DRAFT_646274 [Biscogniauxia mediterranea]
MLARLSTVALALVLIGPSLTAPVAQPANFKTDPMLQARQKSALPHAENYKRANFETDPMLQVGEKSASSYAESYKRDN